MNFQYWSQNLTFIKSQITIGNCMPLGYGRIPVRETRYGSQLEGSDCWKWVLERQTSWKVGGAPITSQPWVTQLSLKFLLQGKEWNAVHIAWWKPLLLENEKKIVIKVEMSQSYLKTLVRCSHLGQSGWRFIYNHSKMGIHSLPQLYNTAHVSQLKGIHIKSW